MTESKATPLGVTLLVSIVVLIVLAIVMGWRSSQVERATAAAVSAQASVPCSDPAPTPLSPRAKFLAGGPDRFVGDMNSADFQVTVNFIAAKFQQNELTADHVLKAMVAQQVAHGPCHGLVLVGRVAEIDKEITGRPYVILKPLRSTELSWRMLSHEDPDEPFSVQVVFDATEMSKVMDVARYQIVGARCTQYGRLLGQIIFQGCRLATPSVVAE